MKKIIVGLGAAAMLLVAPLAFAGLTADDINGSTVTVSDKSTSSARVRNSNRTYLMTYGISTSDTGGNVQYAGQDLEDSSQSSGDSLAGAEIVINANAIDSTVEVTGNCGCEEDGDIELTDVNDSTVTVTDEDTTKAKVKNKNTFEGFTFGQASSSTGGNLAGADQDVLNQDQSSGNSGSGLWMEQNIGFIKSSVKVK